MEIVPLVILIQARLKKRSSAMTYSTALACHPGTSCKALRGIEAQVRRSSGDGRYCFGTSVTLADVYLVPQMFNARRFNCDVKPYPTLVRVCAHLEQLPAFAAARPEVQPDAA